MDAFETGLVEAMLIEATESLLAINDLSLASD